MKCITVFQFIQKWIYQAIMASEAKINLIVAVCKNMGIGFQGNLPWKLKKEMAYFTRITSTTKDKDKQNAVIMGKATWFSIPPKFRPLPKRLNIVLSRTLKELPEAHHLLHSLEDAVKLLTVSPLNDKIENIFVIGGATLYKEAMESSYCHKIYLTYIDNEYECDTFFQPISEQKFELVLDPEIPNEDQEENGVVYRFKVYEKKGC